MKVKNFLLSLMLLGSLSAGAFGNGDNNIATEAFSGADLIFNANQVAKNVTISVSGPHGFFVTQSSIDSIPSINLYDAGSPSDGRYRYQLTASVAGEGAQVKSQLNNGRDSNATQAIYGVSQSGSFYFEDGQIKKFDKIDDTQTLPSR